VRHLSGKVLVLHRGRHLARHLRHLHPLRRGASQGDHQTFCRLAQSIVGEDLVVESTQHLRNRILLQPTRDEDVEPFGLWIVHRLVSSPMSESAHALLFQHEDVAEILSVQFRAANPVYEILTRGHRTAHLDNVAHGGRPRKTHRPLRQQPRR
jgi:hypothetical protein